MPFPTGFQQPTAAQYGQRVQNTWPRVTLLTSQTRAFFTVPAGVYKLRVYAFGDGGSAASSQSGGGGGCAFGEIDVQPGQVIPYLCFTYNTGGSETYFGPDFIARGASTDGTNNRLGGTAWISGRVQNGAAYSGGNGVAAANRPGASSGSPLGAGVNGDNNNYSAGSGWGGAGGSWGGSSVAGGGGGGGIGGAGSSGGSPSTGSGGRGGGSYTSGTAAPFGYYTDPLLALCNGATCQATLPNTGYAHGFNGLNGCGGGGGTNNTSGGTGGGNLSLIHI